MVSNAKKTVILCYAFNKNGEHSNHEVFKDARFLSENLKQEFEVVELNHFDRKRAYALSLKIFIQNIFRRKNLAIIGQGKSYKILSRNPFINCRILILSEHLKKIAEHIEENEYQNYRKFLTPSKNCFRKWNDYFDENEYRKAHSILFYGDNQLNKYNLNKIIQWHSYPKGFLKFKYCSKSNRIGFLISSGYIIKGLHKIIKLASEHTNLEFVIYGNLDKKTSDQIIDKYSNITIGGYTDFYNKSSITELKGFILPYAIEGCSSAALGIVSSKIPLLTSRESGISFLLKNHRITSLNLNDMNITNFINFPGEFIEDQLLDIRKESLKKLKNVIYNCLYSK